MFIMSKRVVIIGRRLARVVSAITVKKHYSEADVSLIRSYETTAIPCGIPYISSRLSSVDADTMGDM